MDKLPEANCGKCGHAIEVVASVLPVGAKPGLFAWLCPHCGVADSVLTYPAFAVQAATRN
jgi:hypothetical protein